ncbi:MFS transporter [Candidatus Poribacteria bacterium]|nr:MFS transporter [Candidatus Poribacteria bacterium]
MNKREKWIVFLMASCHTMVHFYEQIFPALFVTMVAYFHIQISTAGWMQTLLAMAFGFGGLPAGYLADRIGSKRLIMVYLLGAAFSCIFISTVHSVAALAIGLAAMGAFISLYHPAGTALVTMQVKEVGKGLGYHGMGGGMGVAVAPGLAALLAAVSVKYGWRVSFVVFGALGLLVAAGVAALKVSDTHSVNANSRFWPEHLARGSPKPLVLFLCVGVLVGFCYRGVMTYLPTYFSQNLNGGIFAGHNVLKGGMFATVTLLVGVLGQFVGGYLCGRYKLEKLFAVLMIITVPLLLLMAVLSNITLLITAMLFAFFHFSAQPVGNSLVAEYTDARGRGLGYGLYFSTAFGFGSLASGFSGTVAEHYGLNMVFVPLAGVIFIGVVITLYLARIRETGNCSTLDA